MYDPVIVDKFLEICDRLIVDAPGGRTRTDIELLPLPSRSVKPAILSSAPGLDDITASTEEMLALYDLAQGLMGQIAFADAADVIAKHLRRLVPASTCAFFLYDSDTDELVTAHASGEGASQFAELRIPRGQRLTGWVAANRQTILNSDPILDVGDAARHFKPRLRSCLSNATPRRGSARRSLKCLLALGRRIHRRSSTPYRSGCEAGHAHGEACA